MVTNPMLPAPSVFSTWPAEPSDVGKPKPLMDTVPVPLPESSRSALEAFDDIVLSVMVTPSMVIPLVVDNVVNVAATGVVAPITVLSMAPLLMSALAITTDPVPLADSTSSELDCVVVIVLSVMLILESMVRLLMFTVPVPPGVRFRSAFELVAMVLSLNVMLSMVVVPTRLVAPVTFNVDSVVNAEGTARVELRFVAPESVAAPETFIVPSTINPSLMLIAVESSELNVVPLN